MKQPHTETQITWSHLYVETKKDQLLEIEHRIGVISLTEAWNREILVKGYKAPRNKGLRYMVDHNSYNYQ